MIHSERMCNGARPAATVGGDIQSATTGLTVVRMNGKRIDDDREPHGPGRQVGGCAGFVADS